MADATNAPVQTVDVSAPAPDTQSRAGFLATTAGKVVVGVVALLVLLAIAGVIAIVFALGGGAKLLKSGGVTITSTTATSSVAAVAPTATVPILMPPVKPLSATFTFRNVFAPSIKPPLQPSAETSGSTEVSSETNGSTAPSSDSTTPSVDSAVTLFLSQIVTEGDAHKGVFTWNGVTYTAGNGETIDSSPWKVLEVRADSVLMLYGDDQVTIAIGQGISK